MSISKIFDISKRSLLSHQTAINTTAKNISNVNTEGFKRRKVDLSKLGIGFSGLNGVQGSKAISRVRQRFTELQLYQEKHELGQYSTSQRLLTRVEDIFGEPRDSALANTLMQFWNAWEDLSSDPENDAARYRVRDKGQMVAHVFNSLHHDMTEFQHQIGYDVQEKVAETNLILNQIYKINQQLGLNVTNELLDERDAQVEKLSAILNINVRESSDQTLTISSNGVILLSASTISELEANQTEEGSNYSMEIGVKNTNKSFVPESGVIGGLLQTINDVIPDQIDRINTLAKTITEDVNALHRSGYSSDDDTGFNFFDPALQHAGDFAVTDSILDNARIIATADTIGEQGNGNLAQAIASLRESSMVGNQSISDYYRTTVSRVGNLAQEATFMRESQEKVVQSLMNQRDSVSAVSLDEEMTKMIEYERGFQAATKMIITADEMIQTILNLI
ncbi:MAG: flagellar hook-associated protein FlgK [Fidelibacterota bacterium]